MEITLFKITVLALLALILLSLASGLFFIVKGEGKSNHTRNALTVRISLSVALFVLLIAGYLKGWIQPHGINPPASHASPQEEPETGRTRTSDESAERTTGEGSGAAYDGTYDGAYSQ